MRRKSAELTILICCISVFLLFTENLFSQMRQIIDPDVYSEGKFYEQNGILYSDAIVVKFKDRVIDLPRGVRYATISDIQPNFPALIGIVNGFKQQVDSVRIVKQIPNAQFGDVTRRHKITGELVRIHDLSQLFTFRFAKPVPLDSTIDEFLKLPEVEFAHEPVSIVYFDSPNDPKYQDGSQWNLAAVKAVAAWDITHGSSTIKIGIVDDGVKQTHEDLQSKIDGGDGVNGDIDHIHGTLVAGVAAAVTNNSKGVASLGWDLRLYTYGNGGNDIGDESFTAQNITAAVDDGVDIINMSFGTLRYATAEDLEPNCSGWVGKLRLPEDYPSIATAVNNAVAQGVVCVASAGNASPNEGFQTLCDPISVPFPNYPAQYSGVIAVSGTWLVNSIEQFRDGWNYGSFVDVSAPAENIWTTTFQG
ncbi:MAG: S8 family serine peptidase, partial [Nitrososphaera sp.]